MKKTFINLLTITSSFLLITSCTKDNISDENNSELKFKLENFEKELNVQKHIDKVYRIEEINNKLNNYDINGHKLIASFAAISNKIEELKQIKNSKKENLNSFIISESEKINFNKIVFNKKEKILFESYIKNSKNEILLRNTLLYEKFTLETFSNQSVVKNFLIFLTIIKQMNFYLTDEQMKSRCPGYNCWEICVDGCMREEFGNMNVVDWALFATNPGANALGTYASCAWDCY